MADVSLQLDEKNHGAFVVKESNVQLGEMVVSISEGNLTVYHTEVSDEAEGKGLAKKMLDSMVDYARENGLKVIPLCPFVKVQFQRHPQQFADVWQPLKG
jgi:predicted GNAT family acetyltransferase